MSRARLPWFAAFSLWLVAVVGGMVWLVAYKSTPGATAQAPEEWPHSDRLSRVDGRPTLVMLAHPKCVCTRASIAELAILLSKLEREITTYVLFVRPEGISDERWFETDIWRSATALPGVTVLQDPHGAEAKRFGAETSGQVVIYDGDGKRVFRGGITGARGHQGNNAGLERALALASGREANRDQSPVFGCALDDPNPSPNPRGEER